MVSPEDASNRGSLIGGPRGLDGPEELVSAYLVLVAGGWKQEGRWRLQPHISLGALNDAIKRAINEQHARTFQVAKVMASAARIEHRYAGLLERLAAAPDADDVRSSGARTST
jgi:hypothetical protein